MAWVPASPGCSLEKWAQQLPQGGPGAGVWPGCLSPKHWHVCSLSALGGRHYCYFNSTEEENEVEQGRKLVSCLRSQIAGVRAIIVIIIQLSDIELLLCNRHWNVGTEVEEKSQAQSKCFQWNNSWSP